MFVLWGPLTDLGVTMAMYFKHESHYYQIVHVALQFTVDFVTLFIGLAVWDMHLANPEVGGESAWNVEVLKNFLKYG